MIISHIVAASENNVIGNNQDLPWKLPDDMRFFVKTTKGHHILTGRKNFETFGKALPHRVNMIITRDTSFSANDAIVFHDIQSAIQHAKDNGETELMIIGGGEIYRQTLKLTDRIYLTKVHTEMDGDTYYPNLDKEHWNLISEEYHSKDEKHAFAFSFQLWERNA